MVILIKATPRLIFVPFVSEFWFLGCLGDGKRGRTAWMQLISSMTMWRNKDEVGEAAAWNWFQISSRLQQKHGRKRIDHGCSESLGAMVKTARVGAVLPLCPRPSLARLWLSFIWLVRSSHRWPPCMTTGQHNFSGNDIRWRWFIRSHIFIFHGHLGIHSLKYLPKSHWGFVLFFFCL